MNHPPRRRGGEAQIKNTEIPHVVSRNQSAINLVIANRQRTKKINTRRLKEIARGLLSELNIKKAELGIHLIGEREMAIMNENFLGHKGATDIITFDHLEKWKAQSGKPIDIHGELFICVVVAVTQAKEFKSSWQAEVARYVVHGVLHLLGYDDLEPDLRRQMKREENRIVQKLAEKFSLAELSNPVKISA